MSPQSSSIDLPGSGEPGFPQRVPSPVDWGRLVVGATRRRPWVFVLVLLLGLSATTAYFVLRRPMYKVETRILAQRQQAFPSMIRTSGADEAPTRTASEFVHQRENLLAIIREADLAVPAKEAAAPDTRKRFFEQDDEHPMDTLVTRLDRALKVETGDGVITISVEWDDAQQAYHIVESALENFLEARQVQDITAFDEAISLMQGRVAALRQQVDLEEARDAAAMSSASPPASTYVPGTVPESPQAAEDLARLKSTLEAKERAVRDMEEGRRRRLLELQAQLEERRGIYSDAHPMVIALRREIEAFGNESAQLVALREEEEALREKYRNRLGAEPRRRSGGSYRPAGSNGASASGSRMESDRVREARAAYQNMLQRVNEAQLALDTARAAFKHRYTVIRPAEVPRLPSSPKPLRVFGLGAAISLFLAVFLTALPDLRSGRIMERWQVEHGLGLPVLAEFHAEDG